MIGFDFAIPIDQNSLDWPTSYLTKGSLDYNCCFCHWRQRITTRRSCSHSNMYYLLSTQWPFMLRKALLIIIVVVSQMTTENNARRSCSHSKPLIYLAQWSLMMMMSYFYEAQIIAPHCLSLLDPTPSNGTVLTSGRREQTTNQKLSKMVQNVKITEFHHNIWKHHGKCIQISTNMPCIGLVTYQWHFEKLWKQ